MKNLILSFSFRSLTGAFALSLALSSCQADKEEEPTMAARPMETKFSLVDSMKVDASFKTTHAQAFSNLNGETYQLESSNQLESFFLEENNQVVLFFRETSNSSESPWVSITLKNHTVHTLPASLSVKEAKAVCVETGQSFADGTSALSSGCETALGGTIQLAYDPATDVLSGSVAGLKYPVEYFVPTYAFPNRDGNVLRTSGSTRNLNIEFKNIGRKKR